MLDTFSHKIRVRNFRLGCFLLGRCYFFVFGSSWLPLVPILGRFWRVRRVRGFILEVFGVHFGGFWGPFWVDLGGFGGFGASFWRFWASVFLYFCKISGDFLSRLCFSLPRIYFCWLPICHIFVSTYLLTWLFFFQGTSFVKR